MDFLFRLEVITMDKSKLSYLFIFTLIFFSILNILIYFEIIPFFIWKVQTMLVILESYVITMENKKNKVVKDKKFTITGFVIVLLWSITLLTTLVKIIF